MLKAAWLVALIALWAVLVLCTMLPGSAQASSGAGGWAGTGIIRAPGGQYLTDTYGRRLQLHGVNLVAKCGGGARPAADAGTPCIGPAQGPKLAYLLSPAARDPARRFTIADARTLVRLGFNMVRLGIVWEGLEPGPRAVGANDPRYCAPHRPGTEFPALGPADPYDSATVRAYLTRTDRIVALLTRAGLRVVIDMHQDAWGSAFSYGAGTTPWNGEGAPLWATCTGSAAPALPIGWGAAYGVPAVQTAIHHFWANDVRADLQGQFARVWAAVARHFRGAPDVLGYEVANEPNDFLSPRFDAELQCDYGGRRQEPRSCAASRPAALHDGLIGAIRTADPQHVVLFEPSGATDYGAPERIGIGEPLRFGGLALAFHVYGSVAQQLAMTARERDRTRTDQPGGPAWIMDEFGASNNAPAIAQTASLADQVNLSWAFWSAFQLDDPTAGGPQEGLLDQRTRRPHPRLAHALAVPYPWATAGTPGSESFDRRTLTFRYRYAVARDVHAPTEIELPPYTFAHGYTVRAASARVVSRRDAPLLELMANRGAARVSLIVRARR